ncbi:MAG TPA: hypothetical protein VFU38_03375 [Candidatus Krumholzibacteria bacterium]|nr:hypothetical protein [Candidatus Krumholzibacteria bacterium]
MRVRREWLILVLVVAAFAFGCDGSGDLPLDQVDPEAVSANPTYDQVFAILHNRCVMCHQGEDEDDDDDDGGYGVTPGTRFATGEAEPDLSDCVEIVSFRDDILEQIENNLMPPGAMPRLTNEQKLTIRRWVENGAEAPCNP